MLCKVGDLSDLRRQGYLAEEKYDGTTGLISKKGREVTVHNRHGVNYTTRVPDLVKAAQQIPGDFTLHGEIVYINPQTGEIEFTPCQRRCSSSDFTSIYYLMHMKKILLHFYAWSLLDLNGKDLRDTPYIEQKEVLRQLIPEGNRILYTPHWFDLEQHFEEVKRNQREGIVIKRVDGKWEEGRSYNWLKVKNWRHTICDVVGYTPGKNARSPFFGSLVLKKDGKFCGCAGSGLNDLELRRITDVLTTSPKIPQPFDIGELWTPVKTDMKVQVKYYKITKKGVMRFPIFEEVVN